MPTPRSLGSVSGFIAERLAKSAIGGFGAAIVSGEKHETYFCGEADAGVPVSAQTLFHICSCSKAFTATALAKLVGYGGASWDMPVHDVVPEFALRNVEIAQRCTLRDLAAMRLGLSREGIAEWGFRPDAPAMTRLSRAAAMPFAAPFRDRFSYSNLAYIALSIATARLANLDYAQCMERFVFRRHGLNDATLRPTQDVAKPHMPIANRMVPVPELTGENSEGSARVHLTVSDAVAWLYFLLRAAGGAESDAVSEMFKPQIPIPTRADSGDGLPVARAYGFGWHISTFRGRTVFNHGGGGRGWRAMTILDPERETGVMVFAAHEGVAIEALALALLEVSFGESPSDWEPALSRRAGLDAKALNLAMDLRGRPRDVSVDTADLVGLYANAVTGNVRIEIGPEGTLRFAAEDAPAFDAHLLPVDGGVLGFRFDNPAMQKMENDPLFQARIVRRSGGDIVAETTYFGTLEKLG
jgi:CubicO group peptidase (beta-lactamase class C family)